MNLTRLLSLSVPTWIVASMAIFSSCVWMKPAQKRVDDAREVISNDFLSKLRVQGAQQGQGEVKLTWKEAMEKMYLSNPDLIQADNQIEQARQQQKQLWRNLLPLLGVGVANNVAIKDFADVFSNPQLRIYSYLPLGALLQLPKEAYTRKLFYMGAKLQAEQQMRQQVILLYRLFQKQRLLAMQKRSLDFEEQLLSGVSGLESVEVLTMKTQYMDAKTTWNTAQRQWLSQVGDFFMTGYDAVDLINSGIPDISYKPSDLDFTDTSRWGMLQLNLLAMEQIAEDGQILDLYLRYFPTPNLSVSAPPLYNSTSGQVFDASGINVGPSLDWNLDTQGTIGQQLKRIRLNKTIKDWRKDKRQRDEITKLLEGKKALGVVQTELAKHRQAMEGYRKAVLSGLIKDPRAAIQTMRKLQEIEISLAAKEIEICTSFWLIDETRWTAITRRWLQTRESRTKLRDVKHKS